MGTKSGKEERERGTGQACKMVSGLVRECIGRSVVG